MKHVPHLILQYVNIEFLACSLKQVQVIVEGCGLQRSNCKILTTEFSVTRLLSDSNSCPTALFSCVWSDISNLAHINSPKLAQIIRLKIMLLHLQWLQIYALVPLTHCDSLSRVKIRLTSSPPPESTSIWYYYLLSYTWYTWNWVEVVPVNLQMLNSYHQ